MSVAAFVQRVQRSLLLTGLANILIIALSTLLALLGVSAFLSADSSTSVLPAVVITATLFAYCVWRLRPIRSRGRIALWIEELVPNLHYAVVTSAENSSAALEIDGSVHLDRIQNAIRRRITGVFAKSILLLAVSSAFYLLSPATSFGRVRVRSGLSRVLPGVVPSVDKLSRIRIRIIPPPYSNTDATERLNPANLNVLAGTQLVLSGDGSPEGVGLSLNDHSVAVSGDKDSWTARVTPKAVSLLRISFRGVSRLTVVETVPDTAPRVTLTAPLRDSTLRTPGFSVLLRASATDDIGLSEGYFEYLIVSGSGEAFSGRTETSSAVRFDARSGALQARLDFATHRIGAGDLVSIRAVVRDNNTLTGPSVGVSDTRTFRVARADEYDSVSIEAAAPPPVDSSAMSQRMLILMTEALVKKQKTLARQQLVKQSDDIGFMEDRIRKRVYDILYQTDSPEGAGDTEEVESEIQAINNPDLKEAYDALWDAVRSLRIAEPAAALPPMRVALKALDRARLAKRIYLRGATPRIVVDVSRVRLTGKDKGVSSARTQQFVSDSSRTFLIEGLRSALLKRQSHLREAIEDLSLLRARALTLSPEFAAALKEAIDSLQRNRPADASLTRARKALAPSPPASVNADWGGG